MAKFLITGCARSGTVFTSHAFTNAGVWCGHERAIEPYYCRDWQDGEISWEAAGYLEKLRTEQPRLPIFHQVRHPLAVVRSCINYRLFAQQDKWSNFAFETMHKERAGMSELEQACWYWLYWNRLIEPYADMRYRIEDINEPQFRALLILSGNEHCDSHAIDTLARNLNTATSKHQQPLTWEDIPGWARFEMQQQAVRYGYEVEE